MHKDEVTMSSRNDGLTGLAAVKRVIRQYSSDLKWVRDNSRWYKQKPYHPIRTRIEILCHRIYWFIVRQK